MTWVTIEVLFTYKHWLKSRLLSESRSKSRWTSARWCLAPGLTFEYHHQTGVCFANTRIYWHINKIHVLSPLLKQRYEQPALCARISLCCVQGVSFLLSPSRIRVLERLWTAVLLSWIRDDVTIVIIDSELAMGYIFLVLNHRYNFGQVQC